MPKYLPPGKIDPLLLGRMLRRHARPDRRVLVGPCIGGDAAIIRMGDRLLVAAADPITFTADDIGWYAVHVNANDVAVTGALPRWFLATALLPEHGATPRTVAQLFRSLDAALKPLHIALVGGHTEVTPGLDRPILCGTMLGEAKPNELIEPGRSRPGDRLILAGSAAVEGTAIIARERRHEVIRVLGPAATRRAAAFIRNPGISIVSAARAAMAIGGITGMHDPTEGGVLGGVWEMAEASRLGFRLDEACVPVLPETRTLCDWRRIDPLQLIASGALLITCRRATAGRLLTGLRRRRFKAADVGCMLSKHAGYVVVRGEKECRVAPPFPDAIQTVLSD